MSVGKKCQVQVLCNVSVPVMYDVPSETDVRTASSMSKFSLVGRTVRNLDTGALPKSSMRNN